MISVSVPSAMDILTSTLAALAALVLAAVFAVAAAAKLTNRERTAREFRSLGIPGGSPVVIAVAAVEALVAVALVVRPSLGGLLALGLLAVFSAVVTRALTIAEPVSCACFGPLSDGPVSGATLARNGAFMALAAITMAGAGASLPPIDGPAVMVVSLTAVTVAMIGQLIATGRRMGRLWTVELAGEAIARQSPTGETAASDHVDGGIPVNHGGLEEEQR